MNNLPKSWDEINLKTFKELSKILPDFKSEVDVNTQISICTKIFDVIGRSDINNLDVNGFSDAIGEIAWMFAIPENLLVTTIDIDGKKYGFNQRMFWSTIEFIQLQQFLSEKKQENIIDNLEYLLAIFLRPMEQSVEQVEEQKKIKIFKKEFKFSRKKYKVVDKVLPLNNNDIEERAKLFEEVLPATVAYNLYVFFCLLSIELSMSTLSSLAQETIKK